MGAIKTIEQRRSIRKFTQEIVKDSKITQILEAGRLAPSGSNSQPWKFMVVRNQERKEAVMNACYGQKFIAQAPFVMVLLGDFKAYKQRIKRTKELIKTGAVEARADAEFAKGYREHVLMDKNEVLSIVSNCMIAGQNMVLAAEEMGIGSCWVMLMKQDELREALNLEDHLFVVAVIPMGYAAQEPNARPRYDLQDIAWDEEVGKAWGASNEEDNQSLDDTIAELDLVGV